MSSYSKNIARLKSTSRANLQFSSQDRLNAARTAGLAQEKEAEKIATSLSEFSGYLKQYSKDLIDKRTEEGILEARRVATENAKERTILEKEAAQIEEAQKLGIVLEGFEDAKRMEAGFQKIKAEKLRLEGESVYPEADRIAKLSPWRQVGYAKEKLRMFNESFPDKLANEMANGTDKININGVLISPAEMRDANIQGLPFKEVASRIYADKIRKAAGIDRFSPELLKIAGTEKAVQDAIDTQLDEARNRYNIDASTKTRGQADLDFQTGAKTGEDIARYHMTIANTVGQDGKLIGNERAWDHVFKTMAQEGIKDSGKTDIADKYGEKELPEDLRKALGKPPGTTFEQAWPGRFSKLRADIRNGFTAKIDQELKNQKAATKAITVGFYAAAKQAHSEGRLLTTDEIADIYDKYAEVGGEPPSEVKNYETASKRSQRHDENAIKDLMRAQDGEIYPHQLEMFHPLAREKYIEKAQNFEKAKLKAFDTEKLIKAELDQTFADMGVKANEKSPEYIEAFKNAKIDYLDQYNKYVGMGYEAEDANYYALHGKPGEVKGEDDKPLMINGVITEIQQNGASNKYVVTGGNRTDDERAAAHQRVAYIRTGKREMFENPRIIWEGTIGGKYGADQLKIIADSIEKYKGNVHLGLAAVPDAVQFYKGLSQGRHPKEGTYYGLIDAQLKANGYPGLDKIPLWQLSTSKNENEEPLEETPNVQPLANAGVNALNNGNPLVAMNIFRDIMAYENGNQRKSIWDSPEMVSPFLQGVA